MIKFFIRLAIAMAVEGWAEDKPLHPPITTNLLVDTREFERQHAELQQQLIKLADKEFFFGKIMVRS